MNQTTNSAAPAASPDSEWLDPAAMRAIANRPEQRASEFLDCAPRVQAMAREILRLQEREDQLVGPVMSLERILNALGIKTEAVMGLSPIEWIRLCAKRVGKDAQNRVAEIATQKESKEWFNEALPDFEAMHRELFGKVDPSEARVTQTAARVLRQQREELDSIDHLMNVSGVPKGMRRERVSAACRERHERYQQLVDAHDALDKVGCPVPRFDAPNGARLAERIAAIVKQRDRAQRRAGVGRAGVYPDLAEMLRRDVIDRAKKHRWFDSAAYLLEPRVETTPYREHAPSSLIVDQAHQRLTDRGVPERMSAGSGLPPAPASLVERITWLANAAQRNHGAFTMPQGFGVTLFDGKFYDDQLKMVCTERDATGAEVEKLRVQLAACGVLAGCNTRESLAKHRVMHPDYDCDAVRNVIDAVVREIAMREQRDAARIQITEARNAAVDQTIKSFRPGDRLTTDVGPLELTLPGAIESLRAENRRVNDRLDAESIELADARAKLDAIQKFANPGMRADGKPAPAAQPVTG